MDEKAVYATLMWASAAMAAVCGVGAVVVLINVMYHGLVLLIPAFLLLVSVVGCGWSAAYFGGRVKGHSKVFSNPIEQEVLTWKQRAHLRKQRGGLVMQRALVEIENEKDNIVHRQIEAANDPDKPPHQTRFGDDFQDVKRQLHNERRASWEDE